MNGDETRTLYRIGVSPVWGLTVQRRQVVERHLTWCDADDMRMRTRKADIGAVYTLLDRAGQAASVRITAVKVERLRSITDDDIRAEGIPAAWPLRDGESLRDCWRRGWNTINGGRHTEARPATWEGNPWVIAYTFRREVEDAR